MYNFRLLSDKQGHAIRTSDNSEAIADLATEGLGPVVVNEKALVIADDGDFLIGAFDSESPTEDPSDFERFAEWADAAPVMFEIAYG